MNSGHMVPGCGRVGVCGPCVRMCHVLMVLHCVLINALESDVQQLRATNSVIPLL